MFTSERLKGIDVFVGVADAGSFTVAAERLHLTTSAVSKSVARLEQRLRIKLFERTTRRLSLTDAGQEFYRACTGVLNHLEEVELSLHEKGEELKGKIRIDLPASFGRKHVMPVILRFMNENPLVEPHVTLSDRFIDPIADRIDILVRSGGTGVWPDETGHHLLGIQKLIFCASPEYLQKNGTPSDEQSLHEHGCILYSRNDGTSYPLHFPAGGGGNILRPVKGNLSVGDSEAQLAAVMANFGIAQLPLWLVRSHIAEGKLVHILPQFDTEGLPISVGWLKSRERLPRIQQLIRKLIEELSANGDRES